MLKTDTIPVECEPNHLPQVTMKILKYSSIVVVCILALLLAMLLPSGVAGSDNSVAVAKMIQEKSAKWSEYQGELQPMLARIEFLQSEMLKLANGADGLDRALCAEFGLIYIRGTGVDFGRLEATSECPF